MQFALPFVSGTTSGSVLKVPDYVLTEPDSSLEGSFVKQVEALSQPEMEHAQKPLPT